MIDLRQALPTKPDSREFCGRCHAAGSEDPAAAKARVDMAAHGRSFRAGNAITPTCPRDPNEQA